MSIKPLYARVLLKREKLNQVGSIIIPDDAAKRHSATLCEVVAVGPDVNTSQANTEIRVGSTVLIGEYAGTWINEDGRAVTDPETAEYYLVQDEDILAEVAK